MNYYKQRIGEIGEAYAHEYFKDRGYVIMERNYRNRYGEIDIIARDARWNIIFIEVKARKNYRFGAPSEAVNREKQVHIKRVATSYLIKNRLINNPIRFDVIEILLGQKFELNHIKYAFE